MSNNTHKNQNQSLQSFSVDGKIRNLGDSDLFPAGPRKSSFDLVNMMNESHLQRSKLGKSLDLLNSSLKFNEMIGSPMQNFLQLTDDDRHKLLRAGVEPQAIGQIDSEEDSYQLDRPPPAPKIEEEDEESPGHYELVEYLPEDLGRLLLEKQIPLEYVRGLLLVRDRKEIKSIRRLKVQRYLEKRRRKTWDKKICYNCRQKVAEQRLRIKGKFIKKRRAMQILGLDTPISTAEIKERLQWVLRDKTLKEIEEIIRREE